MFNEATTGFPAKCHLSNEHKNSMLLTWQEPDLEFALTNKKLVPGTLIPWKPVMALQCQPFSQAKPDPAVSICLSRLLHL